jgi:uncharacterized circularly permuted ATP-grasp superfamily protein
MGFDVPKDVYIHICGSDLIRDEKGNTSCWRTMADALPASATCWKTGR